MPEKIIKNYADLNGNDLFEKWLTSLKDVKGRAIIRQRINRLRMGNPGSYKHINEEIFELKIKYRPGYRVYFGEYDNKYIILLCGGDKSSQKKDIIKAKKYWQELRSRENE